MAYEVFKHGHIALALGWFGLMFWHIRNELVAVSTLARYFEQKKCLLLQ